MGKPAHSAASNATGSTARSYANEELHCVSAMNEFELLEAIEGLACYLREPAEDPVACIAASVARDDAVAPFVTVVAAEGQRFRVLDNGLSRGREWGFGEVLFAGDIGYVTRFTWIRPRPAAPHEVQTSDAVAAVRHEILFRFAYLYGLRDGTGAAVAVPLAGSV
jgi:hypothetical protein